MPFNGQLFDVADSYELIFDEKRFEKVNDYQIDKDTHKIKYELNILPNIGMHIADDGKKINKEVSLMKLICDSNQLELFNCDVVQDLIDFKWQRLGKRWHLVGCIFHFFYMFILMYYINMVYIHNEINYKGDGTFERQKVIDFTFILMIGIVYSTMYNILQMLTMGPIKYFSELWNWLDLIYIVCGIA